MPQEMAVCSIILCIYLEQLGGGQAAEQHKSGGVTESSAVREGGEGAGAVSHSGQ